MPSTSPVVLEARGLGKRFGATKALDRVDLVLRPGEVHALMGQNGAGKSTLIKLLTGVERPDQGELRIDGRPIAPESPLQAQRAGISTVYQEVNLCPNLSVAENLYAGRYPRRRLLGTIDWALVRRGARELLRQLHLDIDVDAPLGSFPVAIQQMVAIARALGVSARVLILDEPTSSLDESEVRELFRILAQLRERGMAILFVTHFLDQVYAVSDRITVLRNGRLVGEYVAAELPQPALVSAMVGREVRLAEPVEAAGPARADVPLVLDAQGLGLRGKLHPTDLQIHRGEMLGLGGLLGSGRTELARLLFGLDRAKQGRLRIESEEVALHHPADAVRLGLAMCPEERKTEGIVADLSVRENIVLALQARLGWQRFLSRAKQDELARRLIEALDIKAADIETPVGLLSGGNQQKVVLARWLATDPKLLILDEPTRGIDIAAKQNLMAEVVRRAREGMAVLFISAEVEELARLCDRIAVMRGRGKAGELPGGCGEPRVLAMIAGD
ncbi:MAG TPA: sugar ABC transporter ATP-binding protein [Pseudoxanthomonas sp.]|uniref:Sugar ABC transporter ATP-binding protein n=1 Tax=Pseudoxanthomonas helianthi TaxID=1453541 RepID=A0A941ASC9_9GAMM|nr:sugar ABC transporter ATP-binding protein [Pseudoxanthomonas helianthi]MBP3983446.1 sugar ABC transporter ATP-binding protein [Pseudoxanthomonas helianthi]HWU70445.1 sugar ABC transporter ATP-binding protein [Pseudoxanthomonas sp.]